MKSTWKALIIGGALLAGFSATASARDNVSFSLSFGAPAYSYYAPPPPPVYYAAPPVYYAPPPPPRAVYYAPAPAFGFTVVDRHWHRHSHHRHHHRHHRR